MFIEGKFQTSTSEKDGQKRYFTKISVQDVQLLGGGEKKSKPQETSFVDDSVPF